MTVTAAEAKAAAARVLSDDDGGASPRSSWADCLLLAAFVDQAAERETALRERIESLWYTWDPEPPDWLNELARIAGVEEVLSAAGSAGAGTAEENA